jgi:hypothetical protein
MLSACGDCYTSTEAGVWCLEDARALAAPLWKLYGQ